MKKKIKYIDKEKFIYISRTRLHTPKDKYPPYKYKIALEKRKGKLIINHLGINSWGRWDTTHSIGIKKKDLLAMLEAIEK